MLAALLAVAKIIHVMQINSMLSRRENGLHPRFNRKLLMRAKNEFAGIRSVQKVHDAIDSFTTFLLLLLLLLLPLVHLLLWLRLLRRCAEFQKLLLLLSMMMEGVQTFTTLLLLMREAWKCHF